MRSPGTPFKRTWVEDEESRPLIISLQNCPKPRCCNTSRRKGHDTESKPLKYLTSRESEAAFVDEETLPFAAPT
jgi:hypothetical protein